MWKKNLMMFNLGETTIVPYQGKCNLGRKNKAEELYQILKRTFHISVKKAPFLNGESNCIIWRAQLLASKVLFIVCIDIGTASIVLMLTKLLHI